MVLLILGMLKTKREKKLANVTDQKRPNHKGFSVLFKLAHYLFNHLRIYLFVH